MTATTSTKTIPKKVPEAKKRSGVWRQVHHASNLNDCYSAAEQSERLRMKNVDGFQVCGALASSMIALNTGCLLGNGIL
jgi:hypothetical protein